MLSNVGMIYDLIALGIILLSVIIGFVRGFFKNLICLFGNIAAFVGSLIFSSFLSQTIYDSFLEEILYKKVSKILADVAFTSAQSLETYIAQLPDYLQTAANLSGIDTQKIVDDATMVSIEKSVMANLVEPAAVLITSILLFFIIFFLLKLVVRFIGNLFGHVNEIPVLGFANRIAGGALGLAGGVIYAYIFVLLLKMMIFFTGGTGDIFSLSAIHDSKLVETLFYFKL